MNFSIFQNLRAWQKLTLLHSFSHGREHVSKEMNEQAQQNRKVLCRNRVSVKFLDWLFETQEWDFLRINIPSCDLSCDSINSMLWLCVQSNTAVFATACSALHCRNDIPHIPSAILLWKGRNCQLWVYLTACCFSSVALYFFWLYKVD